jgi:serine/threonine protein kinase
MSLFSSNCGESNPSEQFYRYVATVTNTAGTPAYQAPEMLRDEPITEKVDVYSFAVLIWEIYTGKLPWSDKSCAQMVHTVAITHSRPPIPADCPKVQTASPLELAPVLH